MEPGKNSGLPQPQLESVFRFVLSGQCSVVRTWYPGDTLVKIAA